MSRTCVSAVLPACLIAGIASAQTSTSTASAAPSASDPIVASVGGTHVIRQSDVYAWQRMHMPAQLARLRQDLYDSSRQAVDALVGEYLLNEAAAADGISVETLVSRHLEEAGIAPV